MNATVVIPTYWAGDDARANAPGTYDHSTRLNADNPELDRCLASLEQVRDIPRIILLVVCPVSATADVSLRVHEIVDAHPTLKVTVVTNTQASRIADRVAQIAPKGSGECVSLRGYGAIRNMGLACAAVLGHDAVIFLDDDEAVIDADFMKRATYALGQQTRQGLPILVKSGYFYDRDGSPLAPTDKAGICHRWWTKRIEFNQTDENGNSFYVSNFFVDNSGNVYLSDWQNVYIYDQDGNQKTTVDLSENGGELCELKAGVVGVCYYKNDEAKPEESGRVFQEIDPAAGKLTGDTVKLPDSAYNFFPGDDVYDIYYDYNGNIYGYKFDTDTKEKVIDWIECDINSNNLNSYSILPDGRVIAFENTYDDQTQTNTMQLIVMTRVDAASVVNKTVLTFACMYLDWNMRDAIVKFNRASNTHRIVVRDYSEYNTDDDYTAGIQKLNTEMLSGKLPDMIDINTYSMPIEQYAAKGFLADLYELIDADADLSREDFVQPVLKALESADGKLYQLPSTFAVSTAIALDKVAGDYDTWNLAAVKDAMTKLQDGASVFDVYRTKSDILQTCISRNIDAFVDWENGSAHFDSDEFKALLEFANQFPDTYDWENATDEENDSAQNRMNSGKQLMTDMYVSSFEDMLYQLTGFNGGVKFVGYPSEDGTSNHAFQIDGAIAISSTCADKTAAWNFMKQFLTEDYQLGSNVWNFPINQKAFDQKLKNAMTEEYQTDENGNVVKDENGNPIRIPKMTYYTTDTGSGVTFGAATAPAASTVVIGGTGVNEDGSISIYAMTQEQVDQILDLINATTAVYGYDESILNIISDEAAAYFAGEKSLDDTANMIQSRVNLYVAEQS